MVLKSDGTNALLQVSRADIAAAEWDDLVCGSADGWSYGLHGWQDLILRVEPWGLREHSFALRENGKLVAVVPLQFNANTGLMASSGWGGAGPILAGGLAPKSRRRIMDAALSQSVEMARQAGAAAFEISLMPVTLTCLTAAWGVNPLVLHGMEDVSGLSQVIDLTASEETLWQGLSADARRQVRLARDAGYHVERVDWLLSLDQYYALHCETYHRTGVSPHPREYFAGIAGSMAPDGYAALWCVRDAEGTAVGFHNDVWFRKAAYYHTGCSASGRGVSGAGYLLFWEAMKGARAAGIEWYDCGAVFPNADDPKQRGLTTFKTKFGGEMHRLFRARKPLAISPVQQAGEAKSSGVAGRIRQRLMHAGHLLRGEGFR